MRKLREILQTFRGHLASHEQESRHAQLSTPPGRIDTRVVVVLVVVMVVLSLLDYYGGSADWGELEPLVGLFVDDPQAFLLEWFDHDEYGRLFQLAYWSGTTCLGYFVIPALVVVLVFRQRLAEYGLGIPRDSAKFGISLVLYLAILPLVVGVAFTEGFQNTYPFYDHAGRSAYDFLVWQLIYGAQFFALEFFFRGFLIHGLKHRFGVYSILVSTVPYVMIHFGKPLPETIGAIVAGIVLGAMSYHFRSIWHGVFLHIAVAVSMDAFALSVEGDISFGFGLF